MMNLARREKYFISAAVLLIAIFFLFEFFLFPFFEARRRTQRGVTAKENGLKEIVRLSSIYSRYQRSSQGLKHILATRKKDFTLFSFLESKAGDAGIKTYIKYIKPSISEGSGRYKESMVEMKLQEITLNQLVNYLSRIESPENAVGLKRISIKKNKKKSGYLDAVLQILTFQ